MVRNDFSLSSLMFLSVCPCPFLSETNRDVFFLKSMKSDGGRGKVGPTPQRDFACAESGSWRGGVGTAGILTAPSPPPPHLPLPLGGVPLTPHNRLTPCVMSDTLLPRAGPLGPLGEASAAKPVVRSPDPDPGPVPVPALQLKLAVCFWATVLPSLSPASSFKTEAPELFGLKLVIGHSLGVSCWDGRGRGRGPCCGCSCSSEGVTRPQSDH